MDQKFLITTPENNHALITGQDAKHISRILRAAPGDTLTLTDGEGMDFKGQITTLHKDRIEVEITDQFASTTESPLHLTLCNGLLKHQKMDTLLKELTQLGVTRWIPFQCRYAIPNPDAKRMKKRMDRWQTIVKESLKQCRRSRLMGVTPPLTFEELMAHSADYDHKIAFWEQARRPLSQLTPAPGKNERAIVLIGPEGGFSPEEMAKAEDAGFKTYSLGPRILRAETATLAATALVQHFLGDI